MDITRGWTSEECIAAIKAEQGKLVEGERLIFDTHTQERETRAGEKLEKGLIVGDYSMSLPNFAKAIATEKKMNGVLELQTCDLTEKEALGISEALKGAPVLYGETRNRELSLGLDFKLKGNRATATDSLLNRKGISYAKALNEEPVEPQPEPTSGRSGRSSSLEDERE